MRIIKTIRGKLRILTLAVSASIIFISGISFYEIKHLESVYLRSESARSIQDEIQKLTLAITTVLLINDADLRTEKKKAVESSLARVDKLVNDLNKNGKDLPEAEEIRKLLGELSKAYNEIISLCEAETFEIATNIFLSTKTNQEKLFTACEKLVENHLKNVSSAVSLMQTLATGLGATVISIMIIATVSLARSIQVSIERGIRIAEKLSEGNLNFNMTFTSQDEIGRLIKALVDTGLSLKEFLTSVRIASDNLATAAEELSSASSELSKRAQDQTQRVSQVAEMSNQLACSVAEIAQNTLSIDKRAENASRLAHDGKKLIQDSVSQMDEIKRLAEDSSYTVVRLTEKSTQIGQILEVINEIADQTNLLALNAAIEAARAGEHGRGFAVVADEVRKLATRTQEATTEIEKTISDIRVEVENVKLKMDRVNDKVNVGLKFFLRASDVFSNIVENFDSLKTMIQNIASAAEQISTVSESTKLNMEEISSGIKETGTTSEQIAGATVELAGLAEALKQSMARFQIT